jgi:hypothetical protein
MGMLTVCPARHGLQLAILSPTRSGRSGMQLITEGGLRDASPIPVHGD